ncbi:MAG TPA: ribonuclease III [Acidobacteriaceae bacterium]|jgi:ribonuclease III|nr:ribonuclease III [Acidobacteriaceae bacterium]
MESPASHPGVADESLVSGEAAAAAADPGRLEAALGHAFTDRDLLRQALTHRSYVAEHSAHGSETPAGDNERLEYLGDAVVGLVTAESLFRLYPELPEGALTRLRGALVSRRHLAEVARTLETGKYLRLGRGEDRSGGRAKTALLANAMEAVIGAVYLDGGLDAARRLIEARVIAPTVASLREQLAAGTGVGDFKSSLQVLLQARKQGQPEYRTTAETGPDHRKRFFVEVRAGGEALAEGSGLTRRIAEQDAARCALEHLGHEGAAE